jgi:hypothetical protein
LSGCADGRRLQPSGFVATANGLEYSKAGGQPSAAGHNQPEAVNRSQAVQRHYQKTGHNVPQFQHVSAALIFRFRLAALQRCDDSTSDPVLLDGESLV